MRRNVVVFAIAPMVLAACAQIFGAKDITVDGDGGGGPGAGGAEAGGDGDGGGGGGSADGGDAGGDANAAACDPRKPFGTPATIPQLQTGFDWSARFTADELTMFVWSDRSGAPGTFSATRARVTDTFPALAPLVYAGDGGPYLDVAPSDDGLAVIVEGEGDLFAAQRTALDAGFGTPAPIGPASSPDELEAQGYLLSGRGVLYFASTPSGVPTDIYKSVSVGGVWQGRVAIGELNTTSFETFPTLTPDEKTIYFGSDRNGTMDVWVARRDDTASTFSTPEVVAELSTGKFEVPTWVSADGCRLVFRRNTVGTADNSVFVATRGR